MEGASTTTEIERTYALPDGTPLPAFDTVPGVGATAAPRTVRLDATYWDTADLRLAARGVRLRRRTGGADAGWHVKLPGGGAATTEVHLPPGRAARAVPKPLVSLVSALARTAEVVPVARIRTRRTETDLLDAAGGVLATVADDAVHGQPLLDSAGPVRWREIEVELGPAGAALPEDGGQRLLDAVEQALLAGGAAPAVHPSKVGRVLGDGVPTPWPAPPRRLRRRSPAGDVLTAYLREQVDAVITQDPRVRHDAAGSVHKMRVATRRLRSALRTFRPLLDAEATRPLGEELRWLAAVLGGMRDREVLLDRLRADLATLPAELVMGPVSARIESTLAADMAAARREALAEMDGERYRTLLERLVELAARPPVTPAASGPAGAVLPPPVRKVHRRLLRDLADAAGTSDPAHREEAFHDARKVAKRLRYAGEALAPVFGPDATVVATRAEAVQEVLGQHQDSVVARGVLREMALAAQGAAENAFTYGVLVGIEASRAAAAEREAGDTGRALAAKDARRLYR